MKELRIVSFLPAATEMACALGLADQIVGVSHECDYPPAVRGKPAVVRPALPVETMTPAEIDVAVSARLKSGASLYHVDEAKLRALDPTLILTQDLCQVCAPSGNEVRQVLAALPRPPQILWLTPKSLAGVDANLRELGQATGREAEAEVLIAAGRVRLERIAAATRQAAARTRVFCLEWVDPLYCSGHWMAEMVRIAGGVDALSRRDGDSVRVTWDEVRRWAPEVFIVMPCGFHLPKALAQVPALFERPGWAELPAVRQGRVFAVDANAYFARPGPRLVEGTELLAHLIRPELVQWTGPRDAFAAVDLSTMALSATASGAGGPKSRVPLPRIKSCSRCGVGFPCGPGTGVADGCWCEGLPNIGPVAGADQDCLCPDCLRAAIARVEDTAR